MSQTPSKRAPASADWRAAWSFLSQGITLTPAGSRSFLRPRLSTATAWPSRISARTRARLMNSVPPTTRTRMTAVIIPRPPHLDPLPSPCDPTARVGCPIRWLAFARIVREGGREEVRGIRVVRGEPRQHEGAEGVVVEGGALAGRHLRLGLEAGLADNHADR